MIDVQHERMSAEFEKWHLGNGRALHRFLAPDRGGPHDHPWSFTSNVLFGGYVERVYLIEGGRWTSHLIERRPGETFSIDAEHIHEIVELLDGPCMTLIEAGEARRESRFWRFDERIRSRAWHEPDFSA